MIDSPSFCWHCLANLVPARGGLFVHRLVRDPLGNLHRVHLSCVHEAVGDGYTELPPEIASRETVAPRS